MLSGREQCYTGGGPPNPLLSFAGVGVGAWVGLVLVVQVSVVFYYCAGVDVLQ
jgi:hypothetical protein